MGPNTHCLPFYFCRSFLLKMKPNRIEIEAMAKLERDSRFVIVLNWFKRELAELDRNNRNADAPEVFRGAGGARVLADILHEAETAQANLDTINSASKRGNVDT